MSTGQARRTGVHGQASLELADLQPPLSRAVTRLQSAPFYTFWAVSSSMKWRPVSKVCYAQTATRGRDRARFGSGACHLPERGWRRRSAGTVAADTGWPVARTAWPGRIACRQWWPLQDETDAVGSRCCPLVIVRSQKSVMRKRRVRVIGRNLVARHVACDRGDGDGVRRELWRQGPGG
jgi:hypothetical protein